MNDNVGKMTLLTILGLGRDLRRFFESDSLLKALRVRRERRNDK